MTSSPASQAYILLTLANSFYTLPSPVVQQIDPIEAIAPVPRAPACVDGVVFCHGRVIPLIDGRSRLGLERIPYTLHSRLIGVNTGDRLILILDIDTLVQPEPKRPIPPSTHSPAVHADWAPPPYRLIPSPHPCTNP